jgi:hypothetical protein
LQDSYLCQPDVKNDASFLIMAGKQAFLTAMLLFGEPNNGSRERQIVLDIVARQQ